MENIPLKFNYEYRGYRLLIADIKREKLSPIKSFSIVSKKRHYDENSKIFEMITEVQLTFGDEISKFVFSSGFFIHNPDWIEEMAEKTVINEFTQVFYPYLREKIYEFTTDFRSGLLIPCVDLKVFDFTQLVVFNFEIKKMDDGKVS